VNPDQWAEFMQVLRDLVYEVANIGAETRNVWQALENIEANQRRGK